jgi:hypothetical protein
MLIGNRSAGKHDIPVESFRLVVRFRLHQGAGRSGNHPRGILDVQQCCSQAVAIPLVGAVVDLQPSVFPLRSGDSCRRFSTSRNGPVAAATVADVCPSQAHRPMKQARYPAGRGSSVPAAGLNAHNTS